MGKPLRRTLASGSAQTWVSEYHLLVQFHGFTHSQQGGPLLVRALNRKLPAGMMTVFEGILLLEMELEQYLDYHRDAAIWVAEDCGVFILAHQRAAIKEALLRGLSGSSPKEKDQAFFDVGTLLGFDLSTGPAVDVEEEQRRELAHR